MQIQLTSDGSHTVYNSEIDETYHSVNGAIAESQHVFINAGLRQISENEMVVFEVGFGTGLNALLTLLESEKADKKIRYIAVEKFPLDKNIISQINYSEKLQLADNHIFEKLHFCQWNESVKISQNFEILKVQADFTDFQHVENYDLVYFDAFSPSRQPEMWSRQIFENLYLNCNKNAVLTTYCAKGELRRNLQAAGFAIERIQGANGKREMLRAKKL